MGSALKKAEWAAGIVLTLVVVALHLLAATSAGGLWRDEANTVGLATLPALGDVWKNLQYDSFPILWLLIVRWFARVVGPMNDPAFRTLGFVVGVSVVGALWFTARTFRHSVPLVSLALLGMSPSLILWGDSMRAYGFGILVILLTGALLWRFVERPGAGRFAAAALMAIASVHALYYNAVLLLAFAAGAVAVCALNRQWRTSALVALIGVLAAASLAPYAGTIRDASSWNMLVQIPGYNPVWFWTKLNEALSPGGAWSLIVWTEVVVLALIGGVRAVRYPSRFGLSQTQREVALFSGVTLVAGVVGIFLFLDVLSYYTQPWYYLTLLALTGVCVDSLLGALLNSPRARTARLVGALLITAATLFPALRSVRTRLTNVDLIAARLGTTARPHDVVLVNEWPSGITFARYYRGSAAWVTIPPISFFRFHRFDRFKKQLLEPNPATPIRPVMELAGEALRSGHRVFIVGGLAFQPGGLKQGLLGAPRLPTREWTEATDYRGWSSTIGYFLQRHATTLETLPVSVPQTVSRYENLSLMVAQGWRP